jgi:AcrR family transcriptional regulator
LPTSAAEYFADKQALLAALALEGFEKLAKRFDSTVRRDPLTALRKILLDYIAYAEENPLEYRILFLSVETLGELKLVSAILKGIHFRRLWVGQRERRRARNTPVRQPP